MWLLRCSMLPVSCFSPFFPACPQLGVHLALAKIQLTRVLTIAPYYMLSNQTKVCSDYIRSTYRSVCGYGECVRVEGELGREWIHLALIDCECRLNHKHKHTHKDTQTCTQRHTDMHTKTHRHAHKDTQTCTQRHTDMHTKTHRHAHKHTQTCTQRHTDMHTKTHRHAHKDTQTCTQRHTDMHTNTHRHAHKDTQTCKHMTRIVRRLIATL